MTATAAAKPLPDSGIVPHQHAPEQRLVQSLCCASQLGYTATSTPTKGHRLMFRLIFWIALIGIAFWLWKRIKNPTARPEPRTDDTQVMVRCAHCNLHVPQREALERSGSWYCSSQHLQLGPRKLDQ